MSRRKIATPPGIAELALSDWSARSVAVHPRRPVAVTCVEGELLVTMEGDPEDHVLAAGETLVAARRGRLAVAALGPSRVRFQAG
jgi:hypothetical protein